VSVAAAAGCPWTASSNDAWLSVTGPSSGNGNGSVSYSAAANPGGARTGTLTIAGRTFTVNQAGGCTFSVNPETLSQAAGGGAASVAVSAGAECAWSASSGTPWVTIVTGANGTGPGSVEFSIAQNTGPGRSGTATVAGRTVTINQASGCTYSVTPTSANVPAAGISGPITVTTGDGCAWTAVSNAPWITITSGASGTGPGTVQGTVDANATGAPRTGTLTVAGVTVTVNQQ
jgi:hypothetical protein